MSQCPGKRADHCYLADGEIAEKMKVSSQCPGKRADHCYHARKEEKKEKFTVSMPWKAGRSLLPCQERRKERKVYCLNALESGPIIVTPGEAPGTIPKRKPVSMPWKAGRSLLPESQETAYVLNEARLNALESGPIIVTLPGHPNH